MRIVLGFLSGVLGLIAGWLALAFLVVSLSEPDREGGTAMAAFAQIGPFGGLIGFGLGVLLFVKWGVVRERVTLEPSASGMPPPAGPVISAKTRISRPFAATVLVLASFLAWWGWYEFIRSPYLTHGDMTLEMQFRLPPGAPLPPDVNDVRIQVWEGERQTAALLGPYWYGHTGDRQVILAHATLSLKAATRHVSLQLPDLLRQSWPLYLSSDPGPMPDFSPWRAPAGGAATRVEMNYRLTADR